MIRWVISFLFTVLLSSQAFSAATLLPNGQQCFQATAPTSGGLSGPLTTLGTLTGGSGYVNGSYPNVALTGGSGFGATATVTVTANSVSSISITNPGSHYAVGDTLSAATANLGGSGSGFSVPVSAVSTTGTGMIGLLGTITGGSGGTAGTYAGVALTGGSGSGATANITVSGGAVTAVVVLNPGTGYAVADTLSAASGSIGGAGGFSVPVSSVAINQSLAGGSLAMYIPNTNTFKQTWQNAAQTVLNTNPVTLDANGCATIYGTGSYRQVLMDALGDIVWDKITTDTSAQQNTFWAGTAGGTPNAITLTDPGFNGTDGSIITFTALSTNTGGTTINPSFFGNITVLKDTTAGPVTLTGGEIISNNPVSVVYRSVDNAFHILNPPIASASGGTGPLCGATGLRITPNGGSLSIIVIVADQAVMQTPFGLTINRGNVNLPAVNITTGTSTAAPNGMDGESPGTNNWIYIWMIDNGAAPAGLVSSASGNGTSPVMPSGYTYKCRLGAMRVDGSGNLLRTLQAGSEVQYVIAPSTNTANLPIITSSFGAYWTSQSISNFVPPTATRIATTLEAQLTVASTTNSNVHVAVASNSNYGTSPITTPLPPCGQFLIAPGSGGLTLQQASNQICNFELESTSLFTGSSTSAGGTVTSATLSALGWKDKVNAE